MEEDYEVTSSHEQAVEDTSEKKRDALAKGCTHDCCPCHRQRLGRLSEQQCPDRSNVSQKSKHL